MNKDRWLRVRLSAQEEELLEFWATANGESKSAFTRRLLRFLPPQPQSINSLVKIDIDDLLYPLLAPSFPGFDPGEVLDVIEEFKHPRGLDEPSEFEREVWQRYLALKAVFKPLRISS